MMKHFLFLMVFLSMALPLQAQSARQQMDACVDKQATSKGMATCTVNAFKEADKMLNNLYRAALDTMTAAQKQRFQASQVAWVKFRDTYCGAFIAASVTGEEQRFLKHACLTQLTLERNGHIGELLISP